MEKEHKRRYRSRGPERRNIERKVYFSAREYARIETVAARSGLKPGSWIGRAAVQAADIEVQHRNTDWQRVDRLTLALEGNQRALTHVAEGVDRIASLHRARGGLDPTAENTLATAQRGVWHLEDLLRGIHEQLR